MGMAIKLSVIKPDNIYYCSCLVNANPGCPYASAEDMTGMLEDKAGIYLVLGTHDYY